MAIRWIADGSIVLREIHGSRRESHNSLLNVPNYNVQLECSQSNLKAAITALLGNPEPWPRTDTIIENIYATSIAVSSDKGEYSTDSEGQNIEYNKLFLDVTYTPRNGVYAQDSAGFDVYIEDTIEPRNETRPLNSENFIWGTTTAGAGGVPNDKNRTLSPEEAPVFWEPGETLIHRIEGWVLGTDFSGFEGTTNDAAYTSPNLDRTYEAETLLLKSFKISKGFCFRSYRNPEAGPPPLPYIEYSGFPAPILEFIYEYKPQGWNKFYRYDPDQNTYPADYYYIRHAQDPWDQFEPFPSATHSEWLDYTL